MSDTQHIARSLLATGSSTAADGRTYFLYTEGSSLISKEWNGKSFTSETTIAESVRPDSAAGYVLKGDIEVIVYIDSSSKLHALRFDYESDEWNDYASKTTQHEVHSQGNVTLCLNDQGHPIVVFESRSDLIVVDLDTPRPAKISVQLSSGSPLWATYVNGILHVFFVSAKDKCLHHAIPQNRVDRAWSSHPFQGTAKRLIVKPNISSSVTEFEAHVLTKEGALLHVAVNGQCEKLGRVDEEGTFISERSVDLCCLDAQNNTLTQERLKEFLSTDPSVIDAVGGALFATPLATACWSGSLEAVCLLLDNPHRLADPNALSPKGRTPLYYAVSRSPAHRKELVSALLDAGARVDDYCDEDLNTPLMIAVADTGDKDVIRELVDRRASLTKKNRQGHTAVMLAEGAGLEEELPQLKEEPQPLKEGEVQGKKPRSYEKELADVVVAITMLIIAYFNNGYIRDIVARVVSKIKEMTELEEAEEEEGKSED